MQSDVENCEGWLSPGGHSSGGRALTASQPKSEAPSSILGGCWFLTVLYNIPEPFHHVNSYRCIQGQYMYAHYVWQATGNQVSQQTLNETADSCLELVGAQ